MYSYLGLVLHSENMIRVINQEEGFKVLSMYQAYQYVEGICYSLCEYLNTPFLLKRLMI